MSIILCLVPPTGPRCGWRERENGQESEWDEGMGLGRGTGRGVPPGARPMPPLRQPWDEKDGHLRRSWDDDLPEWSVMGNFSPANLL